MYETAYNYNVEGDSLLAGDVSGSEHQRKNKNKKDFVTLP